MGKESEITDHYRMVPKEFDKIFHKGRASMIGAFRGLSRSISFQNPEHALIHGTEAAELIDSPLLKSGDGPPTPTDEIDSQ